MTGTTTQQPIIAAQEQETTSCQTNNHKTWPDLPSWAQFSIRQSWGERLNILEWEGSNGTGDQHDVDSYRQQNGWKGNDLVHSISSPVRILEYRVQYPSPSININSPEPQPQPDSSDSYARDGGQGTTLCGIVHFTQKAESHQGFCHGGSMTSIMDDAIGWIGFCVAGECKPWSGFTVQINTSLVKPVLVGQVLMLKIKIDKVERRKVFSSAELVDPGIDGEEDVVYARGDGLVIVNRGVLDGH
jgi:acyl-coenzyme A thioesterase PaaI-like protein